MNALADYEKRITYIQRFLTGQIKLVLTWRYNPNYYNSMVL